MLTIDTQELKPLGKAERDPQLTVYRASAGSGKTFTLAVEYISLLMKGPTAYRNILAVTFTNKATAEMKERILSQLYGISVGDKGSESYLAEVCKKTGLAEEAIRKKAGEALQLIIHDYTRFHVETIDSFSVSVMRNLAKELSVGTNLNIDLDSENALSEAVDTMISHLEEGDKILSWLSDYIMERIDEGSGWRVFDSIKKFAEQIFNEKFVEDGGTLREQLSDPEKVNTFKQEVSKLKTQAEEAMHRLAEEYLGTGVQDAGLGKQQANALSTYFKNLREGTYNKINMGVNIKNLIVNKLIPILNEAEKWRHTYFSCRFSLKNFNDLCLLAAIDEQLATLDKENNRFLLANVNKLLNSFVRNDDTPFVLEKMGTTISHVMMDEFQDTSRLQWKNFRPLLLEGLAQGADSLVVGDVKQSIYRWRSGDWNILNTELRDNIEKFPIRSELLTTNRRSASNIVAFNNAFFVESQSILNQRQEKEWGSISKDLQAAYEDVKQESIDATPRGYVRISFLPAKGDEDASYEDMTLLQLAQQVDGLLKKGVKEKDIAILVRKGKSIKKIANYFSDYFSREKPIHLVSDEAFRLEASSIVNIIIDAMRCLTLQSLTDNKLLVATLAMRYQKNVKHTCDSLNTILLSSAEEISQKFLPIEFTQHIQKLSMMPLYELVEHLYSIFHLSDVKEQDGYMFAFLDAVSEYSTTHSSDIASFVTFWEESLYKKAIPMGEVDGIRLMTIHKAKGLEFHSVLVPLCDWKLEVEDTRNPPRIWCHPSKEPCSTLDLLPIDYTKDMRYSIYNNDYREEQLQLWVDNLNLLYVAFTRAKENLIVWSRWSETWSKKKEEARIDDIGSSLYKLLAEALFHLTSKEVTCVKDEDSGVTIYEKGTLQEVQEEKKTKVTNRLLVSSHPILVEKIGESAKFEFRQSNRSIEFFSDDEERKSNKERGRLLHHLFENIQTRQDVVSAIECLRYDGLISSQIQADELYSLAMDALDGFERKDWFDGSWQLFNECSIIYAHEGHVETRRPDRVMMKDGSVVVLDYKFGKKHDSYRHQVNEYMQLIKKMGYTDVKGYIWYVLTNELEEVNNG